jgi:hypothetical protein
MRNLRIRLSTNSHFSCFNSDKFKKTSFQNGLTFSAIFSRPSLLKYNILLPPHFLKKYFINFYGMVKRTRSRDPLLSMNMKKGEIFNPFTKHLKCHGFINYLTLSIVLITVILPMYVRSL